MSVRKQRHMIPLCLKARYAVAGVQSGKKTKFQRLEVTHYSGSHKTVAIHISRAAISKPPLQSGVYGVAMDL